MSLLTDFGARSRTRRSAADSVGRPLDLISLHVPKAFGTSLCEVLARHYGRRRVVRDYSRFLEDPGSAKGPGLGPVLPTSAAVLHGHFPATRYASVPAHRRVTFLREPIQRTISHYFFWLTAPKHGNPVHDRMLDDSLGLLDFAALPTIRRFYTETIFGGCDMVSFDLVGVVEDLERDWPLFQHLTGIQAPLPHVNRNRYPGYAGIAARVMGDQTLMRTLRRVLDDDIRFYERFL